MVCQSCGFVVHLVSGMGTRLEPTFNPLPTTSAHSSSKAFTVQRVNEWQHFQGYSTKFYTTSAAMSTGLDKFQEALNKMLQKGDVEAIKNTMQLHDNVFKNQVREHFNSILLFLFHLLYLQPLK